MTDVVAAHDSPPAIRSRFLAPRQNAYPLPWWSLIILALLAVGVYANSLRNGFALDDVAIVQNNEHVNNLDWLAIWSDNYWPRKDGVAPDILYRPLTVWTYLATRALVPGPAAGGGGGAWAFHLGNILLHALATVLAALLAYRLCANWKVAFLAGLIFALHPLHAEVVANVVGRAELLSTVFSLAALLVFLPTRPLALETGPRNRAWWHGILVAFCFFLALLCKETPAALLGGFLLIDLWRWRQWNGLSQPPLKRWLLRQTVRYYLPLAVFFGIYLALRYHACGMLSNSRGISPLVNPLVDASLAQRIVTPFAILAKYLQLTFWPAVLSADYSFPSMLPTGNPFAALPLAGILSVMLAILVGAKCWRRAPHIILTIGLFGCTYALAANFLPIGTIMGERLFYFPSLFVFIPVAWAAWGAYRAMAKAPRPVLTRSIAALVLAAGCLAMGWRTMVRNTDWADNITLAIATARDNPESAKSCYWAGEMLVRPDSPDRYKALGEELLRRAIKLYPTYGEAYFELAKLYRRQQEIGKSLIFLAQAAQYGAGISDIRAGLDAIKPDLHQHDPAVYMPELRQYEAQHPRKASAKLALAIAAYAQGKLAEADNLCIAAIRLDPHFHEAAYELALIRLDNNQKELAIAMLLQYVAHVRSNVGARLMLVSAFLELDPKRHPGALDKAQYFLDEAARLDNQDPRLRQLRAQVARRRAAEAATPAVAALSSANPSGGRP